MNNVDEDVGEHWRLASPIAIANQIDLLLYQTNGFNA
jgi:hypothetical protein